MTDKTDSLGRTRQAAMAKSHLPPRSVRRDAARSVKPGRRGARARARMARASARTGVGYRVTRAEATP